MASSLGGGTTSKFYYYMWRFGWVTYLLALVFNVLGFFMSILAPCSRLASAFSGAITAFALFWFTVAASLMTLVVFFHPFGIGPLTKHSATFVKARNELRNAGLNASIGQYAFGFTWGAWAAMFIAMIFLFLGSRATSNDKVKTRSTRKGGFFRRNKSTRSKRGSFIDNDSQRRVKDEYA